MPRRQRGRTGKAAGEKQHKQQVPGDSATRGRDSAKEAWGQEEKGEGERKGTKEVPGDPSRRESRKGGKGIRGASRTKEGPGMKGTTLGGGMVSEGYGKREGKITKEGGT